MPDKVVEANAYHVCGYTTDGMVFLHTKALDPDGNTLKATFTWEPGIAIKMAQDLAEAAQQAAKLFLKEAKKKGKEK